MRTYIENSIHTKKTILENKAFLDDIARVIETLHTCFQDGKKILVAGNGGSAADAQHFAAEIVGRYEKERKGYPAVALTVDTSALTAIGNDYGFEYVFSRQVEALGEAEDVLVVISTSGNSPNLYHAVEQAKKMKIRTIGLLGKGGGVLKDVCDVALVIPSQKTSHIQESHIMLIHLICEHVEKRFS